MTMMSNHMTAAETVMKQLANLAAQSTHGPIER